MEGQLDDVLGRIQSRNYSEAKEISEELNRILLEKNLTEPQIAYFSSKLFNSPQNPFIFIDRNSEEKDRDCVNLRKYLFESIASYIKLRKEKISDYLQFIKDNCFRLFKKDISNTVKEASLLPVIKILKYFEAHKIRDIFDCDQAACLFLDEIRDRKPTAGMRSKIWYVLALLTHQFPNQMDQYQLEIQDVMWKNLDEQVTSNKPEQTAMSGILKAFRYCLNKSYLTGKQVEMLYLMLKVTMKPIESVVRYNVLTNSLKLFEAHHKLFTKYVVRDVEELYDNFIKVVSHRNSSVREAGAEAFEAFIRDLAEGLTDENVQREKFTYLMKKFGAILDNNSSDTISITLVIRSVGIFSKAMKTFLGEAQLRKFFSKLIDLSEQKVIKIFKQTAQEEKQDDQSGGGGGGFNYTGPTFKQILYKQRLLYSFLNSFAMLTQNVSNVNERESNHLYELALTGLQYNIKFMSSYRDHLYDGITNLIMALSRHNTIFLFWLKKLISQGMLETLKIPDNVYYAGEDYHLSLKSTCDLWIALLDRPKIWSETYCKIFFDEILQHINDLMNNLDISYSIKNSEEESTQETKAELSYMNSMEYVPSNMNDSQYLYRIALFMDEFIRRTNRNWLQPWIPLLLRSAIFKLRIYPRCIALLKIITSLNEIMEETNFFATNIGGDKDLQELCRIYFRELFEKYKEYQDELLNDALKVLLSIPSHFIISETEMIANNLTLAIKKALQVGLLNIYLAYAAVVSLERLVQKLTSTQDKNKIKKAMTFLTFITPLLTDFMTSDNKPADEIDPNISKFNLKMREVTINRNQISNKVVEFLGRRGGNSHLIIPSEFRDVAMDKNLAKEFLENKALVDLKKLNLISWDHENVFTFPLPLFSKKVDIDLIKVIPKVVEIASTSTDRKLKVTACELLHSLIIYMIGKSAQQNTAARGKTQNKMNFSNLYARILPVIFTIAADPEDISTKIFNTLCLQLVRWFSSSKEYENKEVACLLDTLMNCVSVKDNSNLRNFAAVCIGEFVKWCIKQSSAQQMKENYGNIKSIIRRIQNNSNFPDIYFRYGAILALKHVIPWLREENSLVERFILEMTHVTLNIIKINNHTQNITEEMKENTNYVARKLAEVIIKRWNVLEQKSLKREKSESIDGFVAWLYTQLLSYETDYRQKVLDMWTAFVGEIVTNKRSDATSHKDWIVKQYGNKYLFRECKTLEFDANKFEGTDLHEKLDLVRKNNKLLDAQLHIYATFLEKGYTTLNEVKNCYDFQIFLKNVQGFLASLKRDPEVQRSQSQQEKLIEKDPQLYKSKLSTLLKIFTFLSESPYMNQFVKAFTPTEAFTRSDLYNKIFQNLISPFEGVEINPTYNVKADEWRISTCCKLLLKLKESDKEVQDENKFFQEHYVQGFLGIYPKFDMTSPNSFLRNFFSFTEFQIKSFFQGYEGIYQRFLGVLTNQKLQKEFIGVYVKKVCEVLLKFIEDNHQGLTTNQEEKIVILLKFSLKFHPDLNFIINLINGDNLLFQKFQVEILDSFARKWQYDEGNLTLRLMGKVVESELFGRLLLPLTQRVLRFTPLFLTKIAGDVIKFDLSDVSDEVVNTFAKFYFVLLTKCAKQQFLQNKQIFRKYLHKFIIQHLNPRKSSIKTLIEIINLLGLYISELSQDYSTYHEEIVEALESVQSKYFPIKTSDLQDGSVEDVNFKLVLTALMNMLLVTNRIELLKVLYSIIREKECSPKYERKLTDFCSKFVKGLVSLPHTEHIKVFTNIFKIFLDRMVDDQLENNLRWQIMQRVGFSFLEEIPLNSLEDIMSKYSPDLEHIVTYDRFREALTDFAQTIEVLQEKAIACGCFNIIYKRLPADSLKTKTSKKITGEITTTELHKVLIPPLHNGKRKFLDQKDFLLNHEMNKKCNIEPIMKYYHSMCYAALCSIIRATQTKEGPFNTFLLQVARNKGDLLWEVILEKKEDFAFEVQTNFNVTLVEKTEEDFKKKLANANINNIIASKYLQESFFSQRSDHFGFLNWEFDSTQDQKKKSKEGNSMIKVEEEGSTNGVMEIETDKNKVINPLDLEFQVPKKKEERRKADPKAVEVDKINQNPCMFSLLRVIDHLNQHFPGESSTMPGWMTSLHSEAIKADAPLHVKIFIIKIIVNREEVFRPYAKEWSEVLFDYCVQKNNGGKGFHYFLRDVCTTLLTWHSQGFKLEESLSNKKMCSEIVMNLMKVAADKTPLIFKSNLKIIAGLMDHWKANLVIEKDLIQKMLGFDEKKEGAHLWRMSVLQVLDIMLNFKIPIGAKGQYQNIDPISPWDDNMVTILVANMKFSSRHQVPFLASSVCGKLLHFIAALAGRGSSALFGNNSNIIVSPDAEKRLKEVEKLMVRFLMGLSDKEDDKFAYFLENMMLSYQNILQPEILYKCQGRIHNTTKKTRGAIFNSLRIFIDKAPSLLTIQTELRDICLSLRGSFDHIVRDYSEENLLNFFRLLYQIAQLNSDHSRELIAEKIEPLAKTFLEVSNENIVDIFFSIVTYVYDQNDEELKNLTKSYLLKGLNHSIPTVRSKIFDFLNNETRVPLNPSARMLITLNDLYSPDSENLWLRSTVPLMVNIAKKSSDYERKLFDFPLEQSIQFREYDPSQSTLAFKFLNRSQPLTPIFTLSQQKFEDVIESTIDSSSKNTLSPFHGVRATQAPMFSQTLISTVIEEEAAPLNPYGISYTQNAVQGGGARPAAGNSRRNDNNNGGPQAAGNDNNSNAGEPDIMSTLSDTRIAAGTRGGPRYNTFTSFLASNYLKFQNVSSLGTNKIRYGTEGQQQLQLNEIRQKQQSLFINRQTELRKKQITASRKYRIGELPDIEISYKDVIDPLVQLAQEDSEISAELFISIFCDLYKGEEKTEVGISYLKGIKNILNTTQQFTYNIISTLHRAYLEIVKRDSGVQIDAAVVAESGLRSYSYHTTVLLLEELLIAANDAAGPDKDKRQKRSSQSQRPLQHASNLANRNINQIEFVEDMASVWLSLIEVYGALKEEDGVRGLLTIVMNDENVRKGLDSKLDQSFSKSINIFNELLEEYNSDPNLKTSLNKKIYEYIAEEKKESLAAMGKWEVIFKETDYPLGTDTAADVIPIHTLTERDALYLIKGLIYNDENWPTMNEYVSSWRGNEKIKQFVDSRFSWELAVLAITQKDFDRARYFVEMQKNNFLKKWEKFDLFSEAAKHDQLQNLQKLVEFQEFLSYIDNTRHADDDTINREFLKMTEAWLKRAPSTTYDSVHAWNDIIFAREMFCNVASFKHYQENQRVVELKIADLYVENARGLLKKGVLEKADNLLNKAIRIKQQNQDPNAPQMDYKAISSVIKLKLRLLEQDENKFAGQVASYPPKYNQIVTVIEGQQKKYEGKIDEQNMSKIQLLKIYAKEKTLGYLYESYFLFKDQQQQVRELPQEMANNAKFIQDTFQSILGSSYFTIGSMGIEETPEKKHYRSKVLHKYASFAESLLRIYDESFDAKQQTANVMAQTFIRTNANFLQKNLAKTFMTYLCQAYNLGYDQLQQLPKLFDILLRYPELAPTFKKEASSIPAWLFLKWIPQMMFLLHAKDLETYVDEIFNRITDTYPQAILYQFNVSYDRVFQLENTQAKTKLVNELQQKLEKYQNHYAFILSLNQLTHPEHKLIHYYSDKIREAIIDPSFNKKDRLGLIAKELWSDIFEPKKPFVGDQIGTYLAKFAKIWEGQFTKAFGDKLARVHNMDRQAFLTDKAITDLMKKLKEAAATLPSGKEKLSAFSTWLSNYDANNYLYEAKIELPGQYSGNSEPFVPSHITISNFGQNVLVLGSLRRPKRLTMHGSNEKSYNILAKGIEDLRLDQRIEQLYSLMNEIFTSDAECLKRDLQIHTFQVIPMTKMLGVLEWIDGTVPIKELLGNELQSSYQISIDKDNPALAARRKWFASIPEGRNKGIQEQHVVALALDEKSISENFNAHQSLIPPFILKRSLEKLCSSPGAFVYIKNKFIRNYATLSVASYILGVGDRHLENFLVSTNTGEVIPIDFGYSFGQGLTLPIPELMPFRLTRVFESLMQPMGVDGIFRNTMIQCLLALRNSRNVLLDCCEIFVKDPLMDWIKTAKNKKLGVSGSVASINPAGTTDSLSSLGIDEEIAWYPMKKVDVVRKKLIGMKPAEVMLEELQDSKFFKDPTQKRTKDRLTETVKGTPNTFRSTLSKVYLSVPEQVDALIDQARDPNVLGRVWIGWSPYI